ncbi:MAG: TadE/TadG family type IV pilus assembly protein, partial [Actinomycetota bacterium]|nr:TadE/TadG family type IV pilus assembly protein [Actinomycetota bacterium]
MTKVYFNRKVLKIREEKGAAAVEFALLLPALTLILFGILLFGLIFNNYLEITHAAREGVRWASLRAPEADIKTRAISAAAGIDLTVDDVQITLGGAGGTPLPADWPDENYQNQSVQVTVTYDVT